MKTTLFVFLLSFIFSVSQNEKLVYNAKFKNIPAGVATMEFKKNLEDSTQYKINYSLKTTKFIDVFYKLRENTSMLVSINDFTLEYIHKNSKQGKYKKEHEASFDYQNNKFFYNKAEHQILERVYDPIGVIYYLRQQNLEKKKEYSFGVYSSGKIKQIQMHYVGEDVIKIGAKKYNCFIYELYSRDKQSILKNKGELKVWFSQDPNHIPLIIEKKAKYGNIILKYNNRFLD